MITIIQKFWKKLKFQCNDWMQLITEQYSVCINIFSVQDMKNFFQLRYPSLKQLKAPDNTWVQLASALLCKSLWLGSQSPKINGEWSRRGKNIPLVLMVKDSRCKKRTVLHNNLPSYLCYQGFTRWVFTLSFGKSICKKALRKSRTKNEHELS